MHMDPIMPALVGTLFVVLLAGALLRGVRQPHVVGYLLAGVALGSSGSEVFADTTDVARMGEVGVMLLLFFAGMEVSLPDLTARWKVPVLGTGLQVAVSLGCVLLIGSYLDWPIGRSVMLGFVISLSSTAVILKLLRDRGEMDSAVGGDVVGILLAQDFAVVPMLIVLGIMGGDAPDVAMVALQVTGGLAVVALFVWLGRGHELHLPLGRWLREDKELQVFAAFLICFGLAFLSGLAGLSVAMGAFVAGIVVGAARETEWVHSVLYPFQVLFLALFFVSIGLMVDLQFIATHAGLILGLMVAVVLTNTLVNALILRTLGRTWRNSFYGGALLSQVGEFSFVLAAVGLQSGLIEEFAYQVTVAVVALSLLAAPAWIGMARRLG